VEVVNGGPQHPPERVRPIDPAADLRVNTIANAWWYLPGITAGSMLASGLLSPGVAWMVGIPYSWRLLAMSLVIPLLVAPAVAHRIGVMADRLEEERQRVLLLTSLLPICAWCRKIKDDDGRWQALELYLAERMRATATHGLCPDCLEQHFPEG
jgi:hypothetical protein